MTNKNITWNTGAAAMRFRHNLKLKKKTNKRISLQALKRVGPPIKNQGPSNKPFKKQFHTMT